MIEALDALPLTARGKVDLDALRARAVADPSLPSADPEDAIERRIAARFSEVLGVDRIGRYDDFFARGGDSLDTLELAAALTLDHGVVLELSTLVEHPTPARLARWVREATPTRRDLVPLTVGSKGRVPVVFFPGSGGTALHIVQPVAASLHDRTSYAVLPRAFEYRGVADHSITKKARHAVAAMLALDPHARFAVVGRSSGGVTAFEAARQLAALGVTPPLLVLLDTAGPGPRRWDELFLGWTAGVVRRTGPLQVRAFRALMLSALAHYRTRPYGGRTVLFRATDRSEDLVERTTRDLGWAPHVTGSFTIVDVPGTHVGMARGEDLAASVAALERALAEADAAVSGA
jgi:thioesterase domain-containing protein